MSMLPRHHLTAILALLCAAGASGAQTLELRSRPADDAARLGTIDANDPALEQAEPVPDGPQAALGWKRLRHAGTYTGYVPRRTIGKGLAVAVGTLVRVAPEDHADLLTIVADGDLIEVTNPELWATVRVTKEIPVFVRTTPPTPEPTPVPVPLEVPAPVTPSPTPTPMATGPVIFGASDAATATIGSNRILEGTLREVRSLPGFPTRFRFELIDRSGHRFAFVELDEAVLSGTLTRYLGQVVSIYGRIDQDDNNLFVAARVVRLKEVRTAAP